MADRIALVTGAAGPMGRAISEKFLETGYRVIAVDLNRGPLDQLEAAYPGLCFPAVNDISDEDSVRALAEECASGPGSPDILVNNAGILTKNKLQTTTAAEWNKVMAVNLTGPFLLSKYLIPAMTEKGWGRVINMSSLAAKSGGITAGTAYTVSKGGLISLTFSLAAETAGTGVTVNGIAPAYVKTPMVTEQLSEEEREMVRQKIPVKRFCEPSEIAALVFFLAGDDAGFITGEVIDQNGRAHLRLRLKNLFIKTDRLTKKKYQDMLSV